MAESPSAKLVKMMDLLKINDEGRQLLFDIEKEIGTAGAAEFLLQLMDGPNKDPDEW